MDGAILPFPRAKDVNATGPLVTDHPPPNHDPRHLNEKERVKESVKERDALQATVHPGRLHDPRHARDPHPNRLLQGDTPLVVVLLPRLAVHPEVDHGNVPAATRANSPATILWPALVPEITASTCTWGEVAEAALHHVVQPPRLPLKRAEPEREKGRVNQDHPLLRGCAIFTAGVYAPTVISVSFNTSTPLLLLPKEELSQRRSLILPQLLSEFPAVTHLLVWPSITSLKTAMMMTIMKRKRLAVKDPE
jgi:hypothetical protein